MAYGSPIQWDPNYDDFKLGKTHITVIWVGVVLHARCLGCFTLCRICGPREKGEEAGWFKEAGLYEEEFYDIFTLGS